MHDGKLIQNNMKIPCIVGLTRYLLVVAPVDLRTVRSQIFGYYYYGYCIMWWNHVSPTLGIFDHVV